MKEFEPIADALAQELFPRSQGAMVKGMSEMMMMFVQRLSDRHLIIKTPKPHWVDAANSFVRMEVA